MIRAVIFDFDGLIIETEAPALESWQEVFREYGQEMTLDRWAENVGRGERFDIVGYLSQLVGRPLEPEPLTARRQVRHVQMVEAQPILPGVLQCIADAKHMGMLLGVASSSRRQWVAGHLEHRGLLGHFDAVRCRDDADVGVGKPDPAVYRAALRALGIAADEALALEDSTRGIQAAKAAGIFTVAIPNGITRAIGVHGADLTLDSLADMTLPEIVRMAEGRG